MSTKQSKSNRKRTWPNVYNRTQRGGQVSYVVDLGLINDKRERHSFKTKAEANTFAELKRTERSNQGVAGLTLTSELRTAATKAAAILEPHGVDLVEAAQYYRDHVIAYRTSPTSRSVGRSHDCRGRAKRPTRTDG